MKLHLKIPYKPNSNLNPNLRMKPSILSLCTRISALMKPFRIRFRIRIRVRIRFKIPYLTHILCLDKPHNQIRILTPPTTSPCRFVKPGNQVKVLSIKGNIPYAVIEPVRDWVLLIPSDRSPDLMPPPIKIQDSRFKIQDSRSKIQDPRF